MMAEITGKLGQPARGHEAGEPVSQRRPEGPRHDSSLWLLESRLDRAQGLDEHIADLVAYAEARREAFDELSRDCEVDISCGVFSGDDAQGGFTFEPSLSRRLADLQLPVVFDIY
jgi:hypothetical protein